MPRCTDSTSTHTQTQTPQAHTPDTRRKLADTEASAGSAPDISGKGVVNPVGAILSVAMMLRYSLRLPDEAAAVEVAVRTAIDNGALTRDIGGQTGTKDMGDAIAAELEQILKR